MGIMKKVFTGAGGVIFAGFVLFAGASVASAASPRIVSPKSGDTIINTNAQFTGQASANAIVRLTLTDTDTSRSNIAHQPGGKVEATVTTDKDGNWVYVPNESLVPGQFSVQAVYTDADGNSTTSAIVAFSVVDSRGNSTVPSFWVKAMIASVAIVVVVAALLLVRLFLRRTQPERRRIFTRKRQNDSELSEVEREIEEVSEGLEMMEQGVRDMKRSLHELEEVVEHEATKASKKDPDSKE